MIVLKHAPAAACLVWISSAAGAAAQPPTTRPPEVSTTPIRCEFRVFSGQQDVTDETRLRIFPTGSREGGRTIEPSKRAVLDLEPGIYDAQAIRQQQGRVLNIRWAERLVVMRYPDEGGRHLEVINFDPGYGALQLRVAEAAGQPDPTRGFDVAAFPAGTAEGARGSAGEVGKPLTEDDSILLVLPAGKYDIRVRRQGSPDEWVTGLEVPADRTRVKAIGSKNR